MPNLIFNEERTAEANTRIERARANDWASYAKNLTSDLQDALTDIATMKAEVVTQTNIAEDAIVRFNQLKQRARDRESDLNQQLSDAQLRIAALEADVERLTPPAAEEGEE